MPDERVQSISPEGLAARERVMALRPKESDFIGRRGYKRTYRDPRDESKGYDWTYDYRPNDGHGKGTREHYEVCEMYQPFTRAAEGLSRGSAFTDDAGRARRRAGGTRIERGPQGMLFRECKGGWEPARDRLGRVGVRCIGTPLAKPAPLRSPQRDPSGAYWYRVGRAWECGS